jgi:hypothetical protein
MEEIVIPLSRVRGELEESYSRLVNYVLSEFQSPPTTVGVQFNGHYGRLSVVLNFDDDSYFQCEEANEFTGPWLPGISVPEIEEWQETGNQLSIAENDQSSKREDSIETYRKLYEFIVTSSKEFFEAVPHDKWRPHRLVLSEYPVIMCSEVWVCPGGIHLPTSPPEREDPPAVRGFNGAEPQGLKVFRLRGPQRKYCQIYLDSKEPPPFHGAPVAHEWNSDLTATAYAQSKRRGTLAACNRPDGVFALNCESEGFTALREWLMPDSEFLPIMEGCYRWELVHILNPLKVIKASKYHFNYLTSSQDKPWEILRHEFDRDALIQVGKRLFKLEEIPAKGPFFVDNDDGDSFRCICDSLGARGIVMELVWCEDLEFLFQRLSEFGDFANTRLQRLMGTDNPKPVNIECLDRTQVRLWTTFRNSRKKEDLSGKEGYLTTALPTALRSIRYMEDSGSGDLAIYGPEI